MDFWQQATPVTRPPALQAVVVAFFGWNFFLGLKSKSFCDFLSKPAHTNHCTQQGNQLTFLWFLFSVSGFLLSDHKGG